MRSLPLILSAVLLSTLGACGGGDDDPPGTGAGTSTSSADAGDAAPAEAADPCDVLTADEVGAVLGGAVTAKEVPGGGCGFDQDDPRAPSVGILAVSGAGGGFDASKQGVVVEGDPQDVPGVGDGAWMAIGTAGGENLQGQGVVAVGDQLVNITLVQGDGLDRPAVASMTVALLTLVASKA